jgi:restriction system protein
MVEPSLADFGLSERAFRSLERFDDHTSATIGCSLIALGGVGGVAYAAVTSQSLAEFLVGSWLFGLQGFALAFLPMLVLGAAWDSIGGLFSSRVRAYTKYKRAKREYDAWLLRTKREFWLALPGLRFEQELALLYGRLGYEVQLTPPSGDKGVDLVLRRDGRTSIVQCKATQRPVGPNIARELYGTLIEAGADEAILASLGGCTPGVREFIRDKPMRLLHLDEIIRMQDGIASTSQ